MIDSSESKGLFESLYYEYRRLMLSVAYGILGDYQLAEDAVAVAFTRIAAGFDGQLDRLREKTGRSDLSVSDVLTPRMKRFAVVVTRNAALDMLRRAESRPQEILTGDEDLADIYDSELAYNGESPESCSAEEVAAAMSELGDAQFDTLYLYAVEGYDRREIAEILGISYETVKKRLQRAQTELRKKLGK